MADNTLYSTQAKRHRLNDLRRLAVIKVQIQRLPLAHPCERKIASVTTSIAVYHLQNSILRFPLRIPARIASHLCLPVPLRRFYSMNDPIDWNRTRGARTLTPEGEAPGKLSHLLNLAGVGTCPPIHLICCRGTSLCPNGSGDLGIWNPLGWT